MEKGEEKNDCKQLDGGRGSSVHGFWGGGGGQNFSAKTSGSHLEVTRKYPKISSHSYKSINTQYFLGTLNF